MISTAWARCRAGAAAALVLLATATALGAAPTAEDFARIAAIQSVRLSPSGKRLAMLVAAPNARNALAVVDLPMGQAAARVVASYSDAELTRYDWVNDDRLIYEAIDFSEGVDVRDEHAGTFAVDHDGKESVQLTAWRWRNDSTSSMIRSRELTREWHWLRTVDDGSSDVWFYEALFDNKYEPTGYALARLNTRTRLLQRYTGSPAHTWAWLFAPGGEPLVAETEWDGRYSLQYRASPDRPWSTLRESSSTRSNDYLAKYIDGAGHIYVLAREGRDETALYDLEASTGKLNKDPLVAVKGFDLTPTLELDSRTHELVGLHFLADRPYTYWFDDGLERIQKSLDASLPPGRFNQIACGRRGASRFLVVRSTSDRNPGEFFLFDREARKLEPIGPARPWLPEASQGSRTYPRVAAKDGLSLPVYVTNPPGSKPTDRLPAVVLVHGGPWVRGGDLSWNEKAQFLATRGYRVLEPEFRGSTGYGTRLFEAGIKKWGTTMQDDLADTVAWAASQGLIDDKRVCIMGASYGGYAALMSPIRHPSTYRCAISFAGVTDIELRYKAWNSDLTEQAARNVLPELMGDPEKDAALLRESSPLLRVKEIKIPVLLMHGAQDRRVPPEHARKFVAAARDAGVPIDFKLYDREGHGFVIDADEADYYHRIEDFLAKHIGTPPQ